jgi:hypothetical protein
MEEKASTARVALKYGIMTGVASIVFYTILYLTGLFLNPVASSFGYVIIIGAIYLAMKEFRTQNNGFMSYGEGLGLGTLTAAISAFITITFDLVYKKFIDTTINQQIQDVTRANFEAKGMDDAQIDGVIEMMDKMSSPGIVFFTGILVTIVTGFIISLIVAAIMKKSKPVFD